MKPGDLILRVPADFLREARRLFGRLRQLPGSVGVEFPVEVLGSFDGITLAASNGHCRLETFRHATADAGRKGRLLLPRAALAEACRADPGSVVELAACRRTGAILLRQRRGGAWCESRHLLPDRPLPAAPALPDGLALRLPARSMEALAAVAPFADWSDPAERWRTGVCFSPVAGGRLIVGDGRRLACVPARVPPEGFVLPLGAVRVLLHPDFLGYENAVTLWRTDDGGPARVMFRAWDHQLVAPVLPAGCWENDARLRGELAALDAAGHPLRLDALRRAQLLGWLRALRDPHAAVALCWRATGCLSVVQRGDHGRRLRLLLPATLHGRGRSIAAPPPRLRLPPRDLAAALELGGALLIGGDGGGRATLWCRGAGGSFCRITSLARAAASGRAGESGDRHRAA
jgi:hypothetical protein